MLKFYVDGNYINKMFYFGLLTNARKQHLIKEFCEHHGMLSTRGVSLK